MHHSNAGELIRHGTTLVVHRYGISCIQHSGLADVWIESAFDLRDGPEQTILCGGTGDNFIVLINADVLIVAMWIDGSFTKGADILAGLDDCRCNDCQRQW